VLDLTAFGVIEFTRRACRIARYGISVRRPPRRPLRHRCACRWQRARNLSCADAARLLASLRSALETPSIA
jgi:hypothetical protein